MPGPKNKQGGLWGSPAFFGAGILNLIIRINNEKIDWRYKDDI